MKPTTTLNVNGKQIIINAYLTLLSRCFFLIEEVTFHVYTVSL